MFEKMTTKLNKKIKLTVDKEKHLYVDDLKKGDVFHFTDSDTIYMKIGHPISSRGNIIINLETAEIAIHWENNQSPVIKLKTEINILEEII